MGSVFSNNVNSVSKTRTKEESDSIVGFNSAMHDRTLSGGIGLSATRPIGEESNLLINASRSIIYATETAGEINSVKIVAQNLNSQINSLLHSSKSH